MSWAEALCLCEKYIKPNRRNSGSSIRDKDVSTGFSDKESMDVPQSHVCDSASSGIWL